MLFLAVFLGFSAENLRERMAEHNIEKEYIHSLVEDLKSDTLQSNKILILLNNRSAGVDSVITALSSSGIIENSNNAYRLWSKNIGFSDFITNDRTIQQLKNSGGLRLIRNKAVSDRIIKYDQVIRDFNGLSTVMPYYPLVGGAVWPFFILFREIRTTDFGAHLSSRAKATFCKAYTF